MRGPNAAFRLARIGKPRSVIILADAVPDDIATEQGGAEPNAEAEADTSSKDDQDRPEAEAPEVPQDPLEEAKAEAQRLRDQLLRLAADFDNFRKRSRREITDAEKRAREETLRELFPVFDSLERAEAAAETATDVKALAVGVGLAIKQFHDTLGKLGVERINAVGRAFDPALHEAVQQIETTEHPPGTVVAEVQAGYRANDRLIRPSVVVGAKAPPN